MIKSSNIKIVLSCIGLLLAASTCLAEQLLRLVDVGADKCIPCKMMAPILEELKGEYAGRELA
jgi:thioredoxin 1